MKRPDGPSTPLCQVYMDGNFHVASIYDRAKLQAGNLIEGPAIITEMDSTTLVLADCQAEIHETGVILIRPAPTPPPPPCPSQWPPDRGPPRSRSVDQPLSAAHASGRALWSHRRQ